MAVIDRKPFTFLDTIESMLEIFSQRQHWPVCVLAGNIRFRSTVTLFRDIHRLKTIKKQNLKNNICI